MPIRYTIVTPLLIILAMFLGLSFTASALAATEKGKDWTLNLRDVDIRVFIEQVSSITGENFVIDPEVKGKVTVIAPSSMNGETVHELLANVLRVNGLSAIASGAVTRIVSSQERAGPGGHQSMAGAMQMVTRIIPVKNAGIDETVRLLKPLLSSSGYMEGSEFSNALIVSDYADNVKQVVKALSALDMESSADVEVIPLKEAWVGNIVPLIEALAPMQLAESGKGRNRLRVVADERSNSIVVRGERKDRAKIRKLVETFDRKTPNASDIQVLHLQYADAKEVAVLLRGSVLTGAKGAQAPALPGGGTTNTSTPPGMPASAIGNANPSSAGEGDITAVSSFIQADTTLNTVIVRAAPAMMSEIRNLVKQLDVPRPQVLIEAAIVEISANKTEQLGVQFAAGDAATKINGGLTQFSGAAPGIGGILASLGNTRASALANGGLTAAIGNNNFTALIQALASTSGANLLSTPSIITLDNEEAKIVVGQNVPFRTGAFSTQNAGVANPFTTIERQDIGVTLKVVPQILEGNQVRLTIEQEVSSIAPTTEQSTGAADLITNKRTIQTKVLAGDSQTIVLGGLIEDDVSDSVSKVPLLGDIPLLGNLFRSKSQNYTKSNLFVFLRPTVLRNSEQAANIAQRNYGRVYDLQLGRRSLADISSPLSPIPSASAIFDAPAKALPPLLGNQEGPMETAAATQVATPLPWLMQNRQPDNGDSRKEAAAPVVQVQVSSAPSQAPLPWLAR